MPKRKALEADAVSITVRWALSGEILSAVSISHEAGVRVGFWEGLPVPAEDVRNEEGLWMSLVSPIHCFLMVFIVY